VGDLGVTFSLKKKSKHDRLYLNFVYPDWTILDIIMNFGLFKGNVRDTDWRIVASLEKK